MYYILESKVDDVLNPKRKRDGENKQTQDQGI